MSEFAYRLGMQKAANEDMRIAGMLADRGVPSSLIRSLGITAPLLTSATLGGLGYGAGALAGTLTSDDELKRKLRNRSGIIGALLGAVPAAYTLPVSSHIAKRMKQIDPEL
jgi:hypothetical protein